MFDYISQHPLVGVGLVLLIILTVFVWIKAISSGRKRNEERERIIADLEREKALRNEFRNVDAATFAEGRDDYRLVTGMCAHIQLKLEKASDMNAAFCELSQVKKYVYALGYVFEDGRVSLSNFFRSNGEPLLSVSRDAVRDVIGGEYSRIFTEAFNMFDENNEEVSVIEADVKRLDDEFAAFLESNKETVYSAAAEYIRKNKAEFI